MINIKTYRTPTHEIETNIKWLEVIKKDCNNRIRELKNLQKSRNNIARHREKMNSIALQLYNESKDIFNIDDYNAHIETIRQQLNCSQKYAQGVYEPIQKWAKRKRIADRDKQIILLVGTGMSKTDIAKKYSISRQQVHNRIKKYEEEIYLKKR